MIARVWRGRASRPNAEAYETLFRTTILPGLRRVGGFRGAHLLRRVAGEEVELVTITCFESIEAVRAFAGADYERAVVSPQARRLLSRFDRRCAHYEIVLGPNGAPEG